MTRHYSYAHKPETLMAGLAVSGCPCCDSSASRLIGRDNGFDVVKCEARDCRMVYVNPRPTAEGLIEFYRTYYPVESEAANDWVHEMGAIFEETLDWIGEGRSSPGRALDVGCSYGHFLQSAAKRGWQTVGVEPSPVAADVARKIAGGPILRCGIESADIKPESFDAAVSLYVLEHVTDPRGMMARIYEALKPGGQAVIRVPYAEPLMPIARLLGRPLMFAPMHLNDFSPNVMRHIGSAVGFSRIKVEVGRPRRSSETIERVGSFVLGNTARIVETLSRGSLIFPFAGSYSYRLWK